MSKVKQVGYLTFSIKELTLVHHCSAPQKLRDIDVVETLSALVLPSSDNFESLRVVKYSPRFRLAFSLLNEDASSGRGVLSWDVKDAIERMSAG
jgi:hypothetical protein